MDKNDHEFKAIFYQRSSVVGEGTVFTSYHVITPLEPVQPLAPAEVGHMLTRENDQLHTVPDEDKDFMEALDFFLNDDALRD